MWLRRRSKYGMKKTILKKSLHFYKICTTIITNTAILFVLVNIGAWLVLKLQVTKDPYTIAQVAHEALLPKLYPGMNVQEVRRLLHETGSRPFVYEPFTTYKNQPFTGTFVNVSPVGYRLVPSQGQWPPDRTNINIFLFGGSTTFGYGVSDKETIAAFLQEKFKNTYKSQVVSVYNFGTEHYYSTIERILFEQLLLKNYVPDIAIFIDGINEFANYTDDTIVSNELALCFSADRFTFSALLKKGLQSLPLNTIIQKIIFKPKELSASANTNINTVATAARIVARYKKNKLLIESSSEVNKVKTFFIWQPTPNYKVNPKGYLFADMLSAVYIGGLNYAPMGYEEIAKQQFGTNFINCSQIQENLDMILYIDRLHYSPAFSEKIAECIFNGIKATQKL